MKYSPRNGRFRALLRKIREEAGLHQVSLSQMLGKSQTYVSKTELGERRIDFLETLDFCEACNVPMNRFIARFQKAGAGKDAKVRLKRRSPRKMDSEGRLTD
jgi:transcriptional regulator with XRE-family HTH domain